MGATDSVNHPNHYTSGKIEVIDIIESITNGQDLKPFEAVLVGNIIKYISRFTRKNGVEDLKKAKWYLDRLIGETEEATEELPEKPRDFIVLPARGLHPMQIVRLDKDGEVDWTQAPDWLTPHRVTCDNINLPKENI